MLHWNAKVPETFFWKDFFWWWSDISKKEPTLWKLRESRNGQRFVGAGSCCLSSRRKCGCHRGKGRGADDFLYDVIFRSSRNSHRKLWIKVTDIEQWWPLPFTRKTKGSIPGHRCWLGDSRLNQKASWEVTEQVQAFITPPPCPPDSRDGESQPTENTSS